MIEVALCVTCRPGVPDEAIVKNIFSGLSATGESVEGKLILTSVFSKKIGEYTDTKSVLDPVTNFLRQIDRTNPNWVKDWEAGFGLWSPEERKYQEMPFQSIAQIKSELERKT
ncbi:hypothetical protein [Allocoleopsis sp.]|uniref:hypothetical protein n=1 Tax=Allocoleopsis sp. TaxID=3088169 RepID=UPI002FD230CA